MQTDAEGLRGHYQSLSDEALLVIDRVDLTDGAQGCCEAEPGSEAPPEWLEAAAEIPCHVEFHKIEEPEEPVGFVAQNEWRLLVPDELHFRAVNVLDRDIFNQGFEAGWRTHLGMLSDEEVTALSPGSAFCGLIDRIERVKRAYAEEIARRGLR